ncbi:hypothetical protein DXG01_013848 [Tephrocybe rancida]|nr:hypothetical protein DXG01_013848 [Tephrocybe rancida]
MEAVAHQIQGRFGGLLLRRTGASLDWKGDPLIQIPMYEEYMVYVRATEREARIFDEHADAERESLSTSNGILKVVSRHFYAEHKKCIGFARLNLEDPVPTFATLPEWELVKSTKMDTCARMTRHLLSRDDAPPMIFKDGIVEYSPVPEPQPGEDVKKTKKIIIYQEFPSLGPLLRNILTLYGIKHVYIDGQTSFQKRNKIVKAFREDPTIRVIIISSVGSTGLNLTIACIIIFLVSESFIQINVTY